MDIRQASISDLDSLANLEKEYFKSPWTKEQFHYELMENEFSKTLVIVEENKVIGYINYWITFDQGQVNKICVDKAYRKKGYATLLLNKAFEDFQNNECLVVTLEVRVSNVGAQALYEKFGFSKVLTKKEYYSDGEDAYYMIKGAY